jgi:hypothetical protein
LTRVEARAVYTCVRFSRECGTEPKCKLLLKRLGQSGNRERAETVLNVLAQDGCDIEAFACRIMALAELDRKNCHHSKTTPKKLRRLSTCLAWCSGEMKKPSVNDAVENMLFFHKTEFPDLICAFNNLQQRANEAAGNSPSPISLPDWMFQTAQLIDESLEQATRRRSQRAYWGFFVWVVERVKSETGREHYEQISELFDLLLEANGKKPIHLDSFKKNIARYRLPRPLHPIAQVRRKKKQ